MVETSLHACITYAEVNGLNVLYLKDACVWNWWTPALDCRCCFSAPSVYDGLATDLISHICAAIHLSLCFCYHRCDHCIKACNPFGLHTDIICCRFHVVHTSISVDNIQEPLNLRGQQQSKMASEISKSQDFHWDIRISMGFQFMDFRISMGSTGLFQE